VFEVTLVDGAYFFAPEKLQITLVLRCFKVKELR